MYWRGALAGPKTPLPSEAIPVGIERLMFSGEAGTAITLACIPEAFRELIDPEPLLVMKNGFPGRKEIPQGLIKLCESFAATPGTLDARFVWRYAFVCAVALSAINPDPARSTQQKNNANLCFTLPPPRSGRERVSFRGQTIVKPKSRNCQSRRCQNWTNLRHNLQRCWHLKIALRVSKNYTQ